MNATGTLHDSSPDQSPAALDRQIEQAIAILRRGGVVAFPTDTVYGYAASLQHPAAISRVYTIKGRPEAKAIPILLSTSQALPEVAANISSATQRFADRWWPGALTLIVAAKPTLPAETITRDATGNETVALRVPASDAAIRIIAGAGGALAVTSANRSGDPPALAANDIPRQGPSSPDFVVDGGVCPLGMPSTIASVTGSALRIFREGAIPVAELANFARSIGLSVETLTPRTV